MSGDPWAQFADAPPDEAVGPTQQTAAPAAHDDPWAQFADAPNQASKAAPTDKPYAVPAQDFDAHLGLLWANPHATQADIRKYATDSHRQFGPEIDGYLRDRDAMIAKGDNPAGSVRMASIDNQYSSHPVDNRPRSQFAGIADGGEHVGENIGGAIDWLSDKIGLPTELRGHLHDWYQAKKDHSFFQGTQEGYVAGELGAAGAGSLLLAPALPEAGAGAMLRTGGLALDGALSGGLTTQATTPGGVARDIGIGAVTGGTLGRIADRAGAHFMAGPESAPEAAEQRAAASRLAAAHDVDLRPSLVETGGGTARVTAGGLRESLGGAGVLNRRDVARAADMATVRNQVANRLAPAGEEAAPMATVGPSVARNLRDFDDVSTGLTDQAYDRAAALTPSGFKIRAPELLTAVKGKLAEMKQVPLWQTNPQAGYFSSLQRQLQKNSFSVQGLRDLRTHIYDSFTDKAQARRVWGQLSQPLSRDIDQGLRSAGLHDAADAFKSADSQYAKDAATRSDIDTIVGKRGDVSDENVSSRLNALTNASRGDAAKAQRLLDAIPADQAARWRGARIRQLGGQTGGADTGENSFSPNRFLTAWHADNLSDEAKAVLVPDPTLRSQLDDLATVARGNRRGMSRTNSSHSAGAINVLDAVKSSAHMARGGAEATVAIHTMGATLGLENVMARLLASPNVARAVQIGKAVAHPIVTGSGYAMARAGQRAAPVASSYLLGLPGPDGRQNQ